MDTIKPQKSGTLYGIGVGPGDPDLITVKAVRIIGRVDVIFAASSTKNRHSQAVNIASAHIPASATVHLLSFPMCSDPEELAGARRANAREIIAVLRSGRDAAFLTLGDPLTYSTFGYVLKYVKEMAPELSVVSVPGITSYQAAAARVNQPLVEGNESLLVMSGVNGGAAYRDISPEPENLVFLKAYRGAGDIARALEAGGRTKGSIAITNCGLENEEVVSDIGRFKETPPGYWTLIISKKPAPNGAGQ